MSAMTLAAQVQGALALLGGPETDRVVDFMVDPGAALRALDELREHDGLVVRAAAPLGQASEGYAPLPAAPLWIRVMRGAREIGTAPLRGDDGMVRRADRVVIEEHAEPCCHAPACSLERKHASVWIALQPVRERPDKLLIFEQRSLEEPALARLVASKLAAALDVSAERDDAPLGEVVADLPEPEGEAMAAPDLARFALRSEGERVVVRDLDSAGPRASAGRNTAIGMVLMLIAAGGWFVMARSLAAGGATGAAIAGGVIGALFTLAGYAFLGVARFSSKYRAESAPLLAVGRDRLVVLPWVSRLGAVDVRPEGRFGAAIPLREVRCAEARARARGVAVELDTDHGPIDVMVCPSEVVAKAWCAAIDRAVDEARHPQKGASARQRARQRAATPV